MSIQSINPTTEAVLATFEEHSWEEVERALSEADAAFRRFAEAGMHLVRSSEPMSAWPGMPAALAA